MKRFVIAAMVVSALSATALAQTAPQAAGQRASVQRLDLGTLMKNAWEIIKVVSQNLEQVRLYSHAHLNIQEEWDLACDATKTLNPSILAFNKLLTDHKVNQRLGCAPITPLIKYQTEIIAQCNQFYSRPVPDSAKVMLGKFALTVFQSKLLMTKCYPELAKVKLPIPSFD